MQWIIIGYPHIGEEEGKELTVCKTKKEVVGIVGMLLDHQQPQHIDIMRDDDHPKEKEE